MPVDYSKWDTLDVSKSDDTDRQSASSSSDSGPGESHQPVTDTLNELVAEEQRELRRFLRASSVSHQICNHCLGPEGLRGQSNG